MSEDKKVMRKFQLINEDGYIAADYSNSEYYNTYSVYGCFTGHLDIMGRVLVEGKTVISTSEFQSFKEVLDEDSSIYWDGKDTNDIEVGMVVQTKGECFPVVFIKGCEVVLDMDCSGLQVLQMRYLKRALPTPRELAFTRFLDAHKSAHDGKNSLTTLGTAFDVLWEVFLAKKGE